MFPEKKPKQIAEERLMNLATPRYRREKFIDSNVQYDVNYHSSQLMNKLSQMNKKPASSSLSSSQHPHRTNKEVLQLAEGETSPLQIYYDLQRKNRR